MVAREREACQSIDLAPMHWQKGKLEERKRQLYACSNISWWSSFCVKFDQMQNCWTAKWKWSGGWVPELLHSKILEYWVPKCVKRSYEAELQSRINNGWFLPDPKERLGPPKGLVPLMAVTQHNKHKVCLVKDYRQLNEHVNTFMDNADVSVTKLKEWCYTGTYVWLLDLNRAYLQMAGWVLSHINFCRLFDGKSIFMKIVLFQTIQFSISMQFKCKYGLILKNISISSYSV